MPTLLSQLKLAREICGSSNESVEHFKREAFAGRKEGTLSEQFFSREFQKS